MWNLWLRHQNCRPTNHGQQPELGWHLKVFRKNSKARPRRSQTFHLGSINGPFIIDNGPKGKQKDSWQKWTEMSMERKVWEKIDTATSSFVFKGSDITKIFILIWFSPFYLPLLSELTHHFVSAIENGPVKVSIMWSVPNHTRVYREIGFQYLKKEHHASSMRPGERKKCLFLGPFVDLTRVEECGDQPPGRTGLTWFVAPFSAPNPTHSQCADYRTPTGILPQPQNLLLQIVGKTIRFDGESFVLGHTPWKTGICYNENRQ